MGASDCAVAGQCVGGYFIPEERVQDLEAVQEFLRALTAISDGDGRICTQTLSNTEMASLFESTAERIDRALADKRYVVMGG